MTKNWITAYLGVGLLCTVFASNATAGCGKQVLGPPTVMPQTQVLPNDASARPSAVTKPGEDLLAVPVSVVGLWMTTVSIGGQPFYQAFESFSIDGLEFLNDSGSPINGNVCFGVWDYSGNNVVVNHPSFNYDDTGNLIGMVTIQETVTLVKPGGRVFNGTVSIDVFDLNGKNQGHYDGTITGTRITVPASM